jgi:capsular exopolysaccharide synthesis family protein
MSRNEMLSKKDEASPDALVWTPVLLPGRSEGDAAMAAESLARVRGLSAARQGRLVVNRDIPHTAIEQYRRLAAVMYQAQANRGTKTVMVASAYAAEGKSLTATNLALTLSESYRRNVLLIDADLRRPTLHDTFELPNLAGLSDWLKADGPTTMPLIHVTPHLAVIPGGRPDHDPMSGLVSDRMQLVIRQASERFDWVIIDTPPVAFLPDGHLLSAMVDTVVLVVNAGDTPAVAVQRAVAELGHDRIIGVVLNRAETSSMYGYGETAYNNRYRYQQPAGSGQKLPAPGKSRM